MDATNTTCLNDHWYGDTLQFEVDEWYDEEPNTDLRNLEIDSCLWLNPVIKPEFEGIDPERLTHTVEKIDQEYMHHIQGQMFSDCIG